VRPFGQQRQNGRRSVMPVVKGKKYPYTAAGKKAAAKAKKKTKK
jgi:hypothetical protein